MPRPPHLPRWTGPVEVTPGFEQRYELVGRTRCPLSRADFTRQAAPALREALGSVIPWGDWQIGDSRFVIFSVEPSPDVSTYVQLLSEPRRPVAWEVSSGRFNEPTGAWMAARDAGRTIERLGFTIGEGLENYRREAVMRTRREVTAVVRTILRVFYDAFGYRGQTPLYADLIGDTRSSPDRVFDAFTPHDVAGLLDRLACDVVGIDEPEDAGEAVVRLRKGRVRAEVVLAGGDAERRGYRSARLRGESGVMTAPLEFDGGVTADWLLARLENGLDALAKSGPSPSTGRQAGRSSAAKVQ